MIKEPIYQGRLQSDLDFAGFNPVNLTGWPPATGGSGGYTSPQIINIKSSPYNAAGDGVTDDTAAIQLAINNLAASGGGTIFFPDEGPYIIGGPLQDTSRRNAQLLLPVLDRPNTRQFAIVFEGYAPIGVCTDSSYQIDMPRGTRLKSTLTSGSGSQPSVICGRGTPGGVYDETTCIHVEFKNMILETVANPSYSFLNLLRVMDVATQDILIIAGDYFDTIRMTEPMTTTSYGVILPDNTRGEFIHLRGQINVFGFYNGIGWAELAIADMVSCLACKVGLVIPTAGHPSLIGRYLQWFCTRGAVVTGTHLLNVMQWDVERGPAGPWFHTLYELDDPSNFLIGDTQHYVYDNSVPARMPNMSVNGGANFVRRAIGLAPVTVANLPISAVIGQTTAVTDGTASLAWGATVTGGGSTKYLVWYNGTAWTVTGK